MGEALKHLALSRGDTTLFELFEERGRRRSDTSSGFSVFQAGGTTPWRHNVRHVSGF
jgi:hypothetical protein